jgi:monofunctional biosynthetic peptidoglycan transglycosylase
MTKKRWALLALLGCLLVLPGYLSYLWRSLPDVSYLTRKNPGETALMRERGAKPVQNWVALDRISERLIQAVLMGEDAGFYGHEGFDFYEIREAFERNWEEGRIFRGASTITQQLAKNLFLETERTFGRKLKEAILTYRLEKSLSKKRILEIYLNVIEWGDGIYGAEAASQDVFGKSASELSAAEAAVLAAMIPSPRRLDPCARPKSVKVRQDRILRRMLRAGQLTDEEHQAAIEETVWLSKCGALRVPEG